MWQFLIGLIVGVIGSWFKSHESLRNEIFKEKLTIYRTLNSHALDSLHCVLATEGEENYEAGFTQAISECFSTVHCNSLLISDGVFAALKDLSVSDFKDSCTNIASFREKYNALLNATRDDINIKKLHSFTNFLIDIVPTKPYKSWLRETLKNIK